MGDAIGETGVRRLAAEVEVGLTRMAERPFADAVVEIEQAGLARHLGGWFGGYQPARRRRGCRRLLLAGVEVGGEDQGASVSGGTSTIELPADESVVLDSDSDLSVSGEPVQDGAFITLTYTFANAEAVTMEVPVVVQGEGYYEDVETP